MTEIHPRRPDQGAVSMTAFLIEADTPEEGVLCVRNPDTGALAALVSTQEATIRRMRKSARQVAAQSGQTVTEVRFDMRTEVAKYGPNG